MAAQWHLAQLNIAQARGPLDDPAMAGFVRRLDEINVQADAALGFVWRLREDLLPAPDPVAHAEIVLNMTDRGVSTLKLIR